MPNIISHMHLKRGFAEVFERYYPADVADSLAVMHAQLHIEFARGLSAVPVAEGNVHQTITAMGRGGDKLHMHAGIERARIAKSLRRARGEEAHGPGVNETSPDMVRSELRDFMLSIGQPVTLTEAHQHMRSFGISRFRVRMAMQFWEGTGAVKRVGNYKQAKYHLVDELPAAESSG